MLKTKQRTVAVVVMVVVAALALSALATAEADQPKQLAPATKPKTDNVHVATANKDATVAGDEKKEDEANNADKKPTAQEPGFEEHEGDSDSIKEKAKAETPEEEHPKPKPSKPVVVEASKTSASVQSALPSIVRSQQ
eukprot:TRINITY_DN43373_c0_g1_i2.p2 TRINITY_DN43373_c0_g1~~TRINITY_DN43373_c0_g1_i2.p2  ORF type:complete len:138 (+),score=67.40 TRINITY_DN43373_c0_g1_i2:49-462(+)